jgi:uncharacterized membrane protein YhaH (DUF805 family)
MKDSFISSEGRIGRVIFIVRVLILAVLTALVTHYAMEYFHHWHHGTYLPLGVFVSLIFGLVCYLIILMQLLKRLRDMGKGAFWSIWLLIPGPNLLLLLYAAVAPSKA